jgi:VCBS repeat-containing protein
LINSLFVSLIPINNVSAASGSPIWPDNWILLDTDGEDSNSKDYRDVNRTFYNFTNDFLFLRLECILQPNFTVGNDESRYKWFIDLNDDIYFSGQNIIGGEYLFFVEDFDNHTIFDDGIGDIFLLKDIDSDGIFREWESPPDYYTNSTNPITNTNWSFINDSNISGYRILGNNIDLYLNLSEIPGILDGNYVWGTDNENSNLEQAPGDMMEPPVANDDSYSVYINTGLIVPEEFGVIINDYDDDNDILSAVLDSDVTNGTLSLNSDGSFEYTPDIDFEGNDSFTYHVNDGLLDSNIATVTITVSGFNNPPIANDDYITVIEGGTITILDSGNDSVLDNDTDSDGHPLTADYEIYPNHGTLILNSNGTFIYTHDGSETIFDSFVYNVTDPYGSYDHGTVYWSSVC